MVCQISTLPLLADCCPSPPLTPWLDTSGCIPPPPPLIVSIAVVVSQFSPPSSPLSPPPRCCLRRWHLYWQLSHHPIQLLTMIFWFGSIPLGGMSNIYSPFTRRLLNIDLFRESVVHWPDKYYSCTQTCISVVDLIRVSFRFFSVLSSFVHPDVHLWGSLEYVPHLCTQTCISAVHLIHAYFRRALNIRRLEIIVDDHLISLFNDYLVCIYYDFSRFYKWIQYMRSSLCSLLIDIRV